MIRSGILEITDKQSVVLLSAIAMAMDLQEDAAPTDKNALAMEVKKLSHNCCLHASRVPDMSMDGCVCV